MSDEDEVLRTVGSFARAFAAADKEKLVALWDQEHSQPVWQPEETLAPCLTHEGIRSYVEHLPEVIRGIRDIRPLDLRVDVLGDVAIVYSRAEATLEFVRDDATLPGEVRQSFVLRRNGGPWRLIHYHESRLTPGLERYVA